MELYDTKFKSTNYVENTEVKEDPKKIEGGSLARKSITDDKLRGVSSLADDSVTNAMLQSNSVSKTKMSDDSVGNAELDYEVVAVTVLATATTGTGTATTGSVILGYYPTGNQDQFIDNVAISGTTVTITLAAAATANNTFNVVLLKS